MFIEKDILGSQNVDVNKYKKWNGIKASYSIQFTLVFWIFHQDYHQLFAIFDHQNNVNNNHLYSLLVITITPIRLTTIK